MQCPVLASTRSVCSRGRAGGTAALSQPFHSTGHSAWSVTLWTRLVWRRFHSGSSELSLLEHRREDTAVVAWRSAFGAVDSAFGELHGGHSRCGLEVSLWSSGLSLWRIARWTQPLWPGGQPLEQWTQPLENCTVDTAVVAWRSAFGAVDSAFRALHSGHSCCGLTKLEASPRPDS